MSQGIYIPVLFVILFCFNLPSLLNHSVLTFCSFPIKFHVDPKRLARILVSM